MTPVSRYLLAATAAASIFLSGCGAGFNAGPVQTRAGVLQGRVHGGQAPIVGSRVYLMQAGTSAYAGPGIAASTANASTSLLTSAAVNVDTNGNYYVTTDSSGFFNISNDYTCTVGLPVYAYVLGGDAGGGSNANIGLMAVLGSCPAAGNFYSGSTALPYIWINEVTTVAAAYALSGFATDATHISIGPVGSATTYSTLALTDIQNAAASATNLVDLPSGTALATTPAANGGNGLVPQTRINTLANILAYCVNTSGDSTFANCTKLFGYTTGGSTPNSTTATDTATAAINIAHSPITNTASMYALQAGVAAPFLNDLTAAPNDFSIDIRYGGGGTMAKFANVAPHALAVDGAGNVWMVNPANSVLNVFSPVGYPLSTSAGVTGNGLNLGIAIAIDNNTPQNAWVVNNGSTFVSEFNLSGTAVSAIGNYGIYTSGTTAALSGPSDGEFDGSGNLFLSNYTTSALVKAATTATNASFTSTASNTTYGKSMEGIALGAGTSGNVWVGTASSKYATLFTNANAFSLDTATTYYSPSVDVDSSGNAWFVNYEEYVYKVVAGTTLTSTKYTITPSKIYYVPIFYGSAMDGAGSLILPDYENGILITVNNSGTITSSTSGYVPAGGTSNYVLAAAKPPTGYVMPIADVADGSGNIWFATATDTYLHEMVGLSVPVATPISYGVANSLLGSRP